MSEVNKPDIRFVGTEELIGELTSRCQNYVVNLELTSREKLFYADWGDDCYMSLGLVEGLKEEIKASFYGYADEDDEEDIYV